MPRPWANRRHQVVVCCDGHFFRTRFRQRCRSALDRRRLFDSSANRQARCRATGLPRAGPRTTDRRAARHPEIFQGPTTSTRGKLKAVGLEQRVHPSGSRTTRRAERSHGRHRRRAGTAAAIPESCAPGSPKPALSTPSGRAAPTALNVPSARPVFGAHRVPQAAFATERGCATLEHSCPRPRTSIASATTCCSGYNVVSSSASKSGKTRSRRCGLSCHRVEAPSPGYGFDTSAIDGRPACPFPRRPPAPPRERRPNLYRTAAPPRPAPGWSKLVDTQVTAVYSRPAAKLADPQGAALARNRARDCGANPSHRRRPAADP